ncbi:MAG: ISAzo13 family transposase [Singulisphaera sp.]|nr:ISAzo13 family transposase [Singulisphaera sp.]
MADSILVESLRRKYESLTPLLNERLRRLWAAAEAKEIGWGGMTAVARATGLSPTTIGVGLRELHQVPRGPDPGPPPQRVRRPGGGRKPIASHDPSLLTDLEALVDPVTRGDPQSPLRWTCKSTRKLAEGLQQQGHRVGYRTVAALLEQLGYSLQSNRKAKEGASHPDRNAQFQYISDQVRRFQEQGQPVVSMDAKKKKLVGDFKNAGREYQPQGSPEEVRVHDFPDKELGKAIPYGVYDLTANRGWVSVGIDHDTARFAVETLRRWWFHMGSKVYPKAKELLVTADSGGSNGIRVRLWKVAVQELADATGLQVKVCHFPPGTSKWNKIEHRMFCHITENWRGRPLRSLEVIVNLIGSTRTKAGLQIEAELDTNSYPKGIEVSDEEMARVRIKRDEFHGDWNYTISPGGH